MKTSFRVPLFLLVFMAVFSSCTRSSTAPATPAATENAVVNLGIWSNYISDATIAEFKKRTGIEIQVSNFSSNEELLAKIQAGGSDFDVVVPSDYMVYAMARSGLLKKLDASKLPHSKGLDPRFLKKSYDPKNEYSFPYSWGTTGIAVNRKLYSGKVQGWKDLFEKPELAGKVSLLDDPREVIAAALRVQGFSSNSKKPEELSKAKQLLLKARKRIKLFSSEALIVMTGGEAAVAQAYVSDTLQARREMGGKVDYVLPEEGGTLWIDNLVIPASAPHAENAYKLIDFLLEPQTVVNTVTQLFVSPANAEALALLPADLRSNTTMFPSNQQLKKLEMLEDLGDSMKDWDRIWTEVKSE